MFQDPGTRARGGVGIIPPRSHHGQGAREDRGTGVKPGMRKAPLTRLVLDVSLRPTLGGDLGDVYLLVLNLNLRRKTYTRK